MDMKQFLAAMEHIETDVAQVIGAIKATMYKQQNAEENNCGVKFTQQEVNLMPKTFRKEFRVEGCTAHVRKKQNSKNSFSYEIRYRRNGYNVCASATTIEEAKQKFIEKLKEVDSKKALTAIPTKFDAFAQHFFENYYKEKVVKSTFQNVTVIYKNHIKNYFKNADIRQIHPIDCKKMLDAIKAKGYGKTADEAHSILNQIFKLAIGYGIIQQNPLTVVPHRQHERQNGKRLTIEEEHKLLKESAGKFKSIFAMYLYAGIRPCEIKTVRIEEPFVICQNAKQKERKYVEKKIPITSNLRKYLVPQDIEHTPKLDTIRAEFNRIVPGHTLKDCRRTFNSHCKECGVNEDVRKLFMGHSLGGKVEMAYTEFTDEFLLKEAAKLVY